MIKVDCHTHSIFSSDGRLNVEEMMEIALKKNLKYLAITDHVDYDAQLSKNDAPPHWLLPDMDEYCSTVLKYKQQVQNKGLYLAFGAEMGFDKDPSAQKPTAQLIRDFPFDVIINSVHFVDGVNAYSQRYFEGKTKHEAYGRYLETVYDSLFAEYRFDIVGHFGYCMRRAPYDDVKIDTSEFGDILDKIFLRMIETHKTLEVNTGHILCPNQEVVRRYFELGGRNVSFGSDTHNGSLCKGFEDVVNMLKEIGFTELSVFKVGKREEIPI